MSAVSGVKKHVLLLLGSSKVELYRNHECVIYFYANRYLMYLDVVAYESFGVLNRQFLCPVKCTFWDVFFDPHREIISDRVSSHGAEQVKQGPL
jgi:hypothetical protein